MKVLLLAGTREAREVAAWLHEVKMSAIASFAGVTQDPELPAIATRVGGFGGAAGFRAYLEEERITHVLDATHPFAAQISARSAQVACELGVTYCQLLRPEWEPGPGDVWHMIASEEDAATHIPQGARVFLATGRQTLERYANLADRELICRQIDPPSGPFPFPNGRFHIARPPFTVEAERALFSELAIDWLVVKNAGGAASATKLTAARELGIPVAMITRPPQPPGHKVASAQEAIAWLISQNA
ncbi:MAG: cobalt-precorrin-6A reductase [Pseudomonadota bacterium]